MKTYDLPITHNPLITRDDVAESLKQILEPCGDALVLDGAGLFVSNSTAHYSARGTLLEGWSRLLWGIGPLRAGGYSWSGQDKHFRGLIEGTNPEGKNYWGYVESFDQRMVEMAAIALSLLISPEFYWDPLSQKERDNLATWLNMINTHDMSHNNWLFFRVLVNLALEKHSRKEFNPTLMESDLVELEDMYAADGWYHDKMPFDNYNPFAMQYYSLIYYTFKKDTDIERCKRFKERVTLFANQHIHYLTNEGSFVPFGRSLTYRFAVISFYSACAFAGIEVLPWGVLKGIVLRNLRWWFQKPIFDRDGFLTIGYVNPTLIIGEQYNAPGSPYWSLKTYIILALKEDHPFWTSKELPLPKLEKTKLLNVPNTIMQRTEDDDVVMLNGGQYPEYHMMHIAEKYAKFAYSAHYGFSASSSYYDFEKCGCDSMLYFSDDGETFRPRREMEILTKNEDYVSSLWKPYPDVEVITYLVPAGDCHIRVHKIKSNRSIVTREGGFAIELHRGMEAENTPDIFKEIDSSICIKMPWDITIINDLKQERKAVSVCPTPNLNYMATTTIVPVLEDKINKGESKTYVSLVGAFRNKSDYYKNIPDVKWNEATSTLILGDKSIVLK
jgi:hypothetical protein